MSFTLEKLYSLLPAVYRIRDLESNGESGALLGNITPADSSPQPLKSLLTILQEQIEVLEENLDQLYDDQFIETCAEWVIPYIGDLVGYQRPHDAGARSLRTDVAYMMSYRRRKGTSALVEQLARNVTGWGAHVVEYFDVLARTQHVNSPRPNNRLIDVSHDNLALLTTPFESQAHTADIRHVTAERGAYSPTNVGIFLWRLFAYPLTNVPATKLDDYRYLLNPLGCNTQLFSRASTTQLVETLTGPQSVALPLSRYLQTTCLDDYYGTGKSILLIQDGTPVLPDAQQQLSDLFVISDLSDLVDDDENFVDWANMPEGKIAIDPVRGRVAFPRDKPAPQDVRSNYYYGFSADIGGGEYQRIDSFTDLASPANLTSHPYATSIVRIAQDDTETLQAALDVVLQQGDGVVEITDSGRYQEIPYIDVKANQRIELRAADFCRPLLRIEHEIENVDDTSGDEETDELEDREEMGIPEFVIQGEDGSQVTINGLLISGGRLHIQGTPARVTLKHCTLVPGIALLENGIPQYPGEASILVESESVTLVIDSCIVGGLQVAEGASVRISNSIIDANDETSPAYAALEAVESDDSNDGNGLALGGSLYVENSTLIGTVRTCLLSMASNTIFLAAPADEEDEQEWAVGAIFVQRIQEGGLRYSYVPIGSRVPRRYKCQPTQDTQGMDRLHLTSFHYGNAGYGQLSKRCSSLITQGADDGSEMGAFHLLYQPQREANLTVRLTEYTRFDVTPEIYFMT